MFVARIRGCRQTGAPQTRCRLGAMLNNRAQTGRGLHHSCFILSTYPPTSLPIHLSHVSTASSTNSDETFPGTENSLPPPCSALCLNPLPPATVVCCFHRKLARRPLRWISCIARCLPVKVFCGFCIHLLLSVSLSLSVSPALHLTPATAPCFSFVLSKMSIWSDTTDVCRYAIGRIC